MSLSDRELYRLFDRSPIGMYRASEDGVFQYVNPTLAKLLGYDTVEELLAANLNRDIYIDPEDRARLIKRYRPDGVVDGAKVHWKTKQGARLVVQIWGHLAERDGEPPSFDAWVLDVTELESANAELRRQREALETTASTLDLVVKQMPAIYWIVDRDLRIQRTGGAIKDLLGYAPHRFLGITLEEVHRTEPGSVDPVAQHRRALAGETVTYATEYRNKYLVTTVTPHRVDDHIVGAIGTCIDVTQSTMLERRMIDAQRAESLGVLAGGLAHDFNNLLVAILGNADLGLREVRPGAPGHGAIENIRQAGLRAAELVDQLLAFAGRGGVAATRVSPGPLVDELLRIAAPTIPATVAIHVDIPAGLAMRGDPGQIRQVMLNLIGNAREALGERGGTIQISASHFHHEGAVDPDDVISASPGSYVALEVADDGPGMTSDLRRRIFEPFFTTKSTGHGLGLAAVAGIVRAHGGGLRLHSAPGEGARFCVLWPSTVTPLEQAAVSAPAARTVLVIDDEDLVRDVVVRMIQDLGYAAISAADGPAGLAIAERQSIDAVLVDLTMPRMSGADVVARLHAQKPDLPVIVCSGYDRAGNHRLQADAYLRKPFRIEALEETLARFLGPAVT